MCEDLAKIKYELIFLCSKAFASWIFSNPDRIKFFKHTSVSVLISVFIRTEVSFALFRSTILCIRGCRALRQQALLTPHLLQFQWRQICLNPSF